MKLIINTANLLPGGAFQRAISFLNELKVFGQDSYLIILNHHVKNELDITSFPENYQFKLLNHSPAELKYLIQTRKILKNIESEFQPDLVFSFVGPSYWRPKSPHLVGFALGHLVYNDFSYVKNYSYKTKLEMVYKKFWTIKEADYYVVQTSDIKERLWSNLSVPKNKTFIVTNGAGYQYHLATPENRNSNTTKRLLMLSTYRPNKNFEIIRKVIPYLENYAFKYEFHVTLKDGEYQYLFNGLEASVINHGYVPAEKAPELYNHCDAMFLPTHLECFSASYAEAMKMEKPILTSNLSFATSVCGEAAIYFDNLDPKDIAEKINKLFNDNSLYQSLVNLGKKQLQTFDSSRTQAEKYIKICKSILS
ncbi:glycosyltransferase [Salinimicrobium gaetbulicola]|uniref:Glycosyltransferase n=1 Tax=Salinimicrobium gaetbulicola TaxID=999702 RepID=A0ABW3IFW3_9FLAO